jgi:hypothetical protein
MQKTDLDPGSGPDVTRRAASRKPRPGMADQIV